MWRLTMMAAALVAGVAAAPAVAYAPPAEVLAAGLAAHAAGQYGAARTEFKTLADQGSAIGETMLGVIYDRGQGTPRDAATAASYWLRAANRGYPPAQLALAQALAAGSGVARDAGAAWVWANLAARAGDAATARAAAALAAQLRPGFKPAELAELDRKLAGWRPWAAREQ